MRKYIINLILLISAIIFCFSGWKLYGIRHSYQEAEKEYETIRKETHADEKKKGKKIDRKIDFSRLKKINPDVVGWIYIPGTSIDYPVVKGKDNEEYLHKTFQGKINSSGAIFMDCNGKKDFSGEHNILYGHYMRNGSMFADLLKFRKESFVKKYDSAILYTPEKTVYLKIFAAYGKKADQNILLSFGNPQEKFHYLQDIFKRNEIKSGNLINNIENIQKIYTFVTCSYEAENQRTFVHGMEVGKQEINEVK